MLPQYLGYKKYFHTQENRFISKKVEMTIILTGFPPETCGNDERKQAVKAVILGPACRQAGLTRGFRVFST